MAGNGKTPDGLGDKPFETGRDGDLPNRNGEADPDNPLGKLDK